MYRLLISIVKFLSKILYRYSVVGDVELDSSSNYIICANHKHVLDPVLLSIAFEKEINFLAKKELFDNKILAFFLKKLNSIPVDRHNNDLKAIKTSVRRLREGNTLGIFIEGTRVKDYNPENAKQGAPLIARMANAKIVPVYIEGNYRPFKKMNIIIRDTYEVTSKDYKKEAENILKIIYFG